MKDYKLTGNALFDRDSDPVILVQNGKVCYYNSSAESLFQSTARLEEGGALPPALADLKEEGLCTVEGLDWRVTRTRLPEGDLYRMCEQSARPGLLTSERLREMARQLRDAVDAMARAVRRLEEDLVETERVRQEAPIATLERRIHQLMCLCWDMDILGQAEEPGEMEKLYPLSYLDLEQLCQDLCLEAEYLVECAGCKLECIPSGDHRPMVVKGHKYLLTLLLGHLIADAVGSLYGASGEIRVKLGRSRDQVFVSVDRIGERNENVPLGPGGIPWRGGLNELGVPVCEEIVKFHEGSVATTEADQFRCLVLSLPAADESVELPFHPLRCMEVDFTGGYVPSLVLLSRLLPEKVFAHRELE